jgi:hypothetical protein
MADKTNLAGSSEASCKGNCWLHGRAHGLLSCPPSSGLRVLLAVGVGLGIELSNDYCCNAVIAAWNKTKADKTRSGRWGNGERDIARHQALGHSMN